MDSTTVTLNRKHYLDLAKSQGLTVALSALHKEMEDIEQYSFEGREGYQPELYKKLEEFRTFSRELWELRYDNQSTAI